MVYVTGDGGADQRQHPNDRDGHGHDEDASEDRVAGGRQVIQPRIHVGLLWVAACPTRLPPVLRPPDLTLWPDRRITVSRVHQWCTSTPGQCHCRLARRSAAWFGLSLLGVRRSWVMAWWSTARTSSCQPSTRTVSPGSGRRPRRSRTRPATVVYGPSGRVRSRSGRSWMGKDPARSSDPSGWRWMPTESRSNSS